MKTYDIHNKLNSIFDSKNIKESLQSKEYQILAFICIIGIVLRFFQLGHESIWLDEATSVKIAANGIVDIIKITQGDVHPPLYYITLHLTMWNSASEFSVRFASALFGILSIPFIYLIAKNLFTSREGLLSAFLLAISLMHIYYSQEARMYSLLMFTTLAGCYYFYKANVTNSTMNWVGFVIFISMAIYSHYFGFFMLAILATYFIAINLSAFRQNRKNLFQDSKIRKFFLSTIFLVILIIPRIAVFLEQASSRVGGEVTWGIGPSSLIPILFTKFTGFFNISWIYVILFLIGLTVVIIYNKKQALLLTLWFFLPIPVSYYLSSVMPFQPRYLIFVLPAFLILISKGTTSIINYLLPLENKNVHKNVIATLVIALIILFSVVPSINAYYSHDQKNDWEQTSDYLEKITVNGDTIVPLPGYMGKPLNYYYNSNSDNTRIENVQYDQKSLTKISQQSSNVYFVLTGDINAADPNGKVLSWLQNNAYVVNQIGGIYILKPNSQRNQSF